MKNLVHFQQMVYSILSYFIMIILSYFLFFNYWLIVNFIALVFNLKSDLFIIFFCLITMKQFRIDCSMCLFSVIIKENALLFLAIYLQHFSFHLPILWLLTLILSLVFKINLLMIFKILKLLRFLQFNFLTSSIIFQFHFNLLNPPMLIPLK